MFTDYKLSVNTIFPIPGSRQKFRRVGRGISAGQGKSCGTGQHGQNSRSGAGTRPGFEGGQTPLYRRLPKYVGKTMRGHTKTEYALIKLEKLNEVEAGSTVEFKTLLEKGIVTKPNKGRDIFKVVGNGELTVKGLTVRAHAFTESAKAAIEANGGNCIILSPTRHIPIEEAMADAKAKKDANLVKLKEFRVLKAKRDEAKAMA